METKTYTNEVPKQRLIDGVLAISKANTWLQAINEFDLEHLYQQEGKSCECGKTPIKNVCVVRNRETNKTLEVGNCCIEKFFVEMSSNMFFMSLNKLKKDNTASLSLAVIQALHERNLLSDFETKFYMDIQRKRKLSQKQREIKQRLNMMFLSFFGDGENDKDPTSLMWGNTKELLDRYTKWFEREISSREAQGKGIFKLERKLNFLRSFYSFLEARNYLTPKQVETMWGIIDNCEMPLEGSYQRWDNTHNGYLIAQYRNNIPVSIMIDGKVILECQMNENGKVVQYHDNIGNYWDETIPMDFPIDVYPIKKYIGCLSGHCYCFGEAI